MCEFSNQLIAEAKRYRDAFNIDWYYSQHAESSNNITNEKERV